MKTILSQLPSRISKYPPSEQIYLNEFLSIIQSYNADTQNDRNQLILRFDKSIHKYYASQDIRDLPFLWFVVSYLSNASRLLSVSSFHADDFYYYLVKHLRGDSNTIGAFHLIAKRTPLSDLAWEKLQYACTKLSVPLTSEEIHVLETIHDLCIETGIDALNPSRIKAIIENRIKKPKITQKLNQLFTRLDALWYSRYFPPSIDLEFLNFHFQLSESSSLEKIINFHDLANTTLSCSSVYRIRGFQNMFFGNLIIPTQYFETLQNYLQNCERQGLLIIHELSKVNTTRMGASLFLYKANRGWNNPTTTEKRRLAQLLKTKHPRKKRVKLPLFLSPAFNEFWHYNLNSKPSQIIELCCKFIRSFSYKMLPLGMKNSHENLRFSKSELSQLKDLFFNQVIHVFFVPIRLLHEFSLDFYWMKIPKIPLVQLSRFLAWLPYSILYFTEKDINIRAYLTHELAQWIRNDLKWTIMPIIEVFSPHQLLFEWFSTSNHQWKLPIVLKKET